MQHLKFKKTGNLNWPVEKKHFKGDFFLQNKGYNYHMAHYVSYGKLDVTPIPHSYPMR